jgi:hypothetical protein
VPVAVREADRSLALLGEIEAGPDALDVVGMQQLEIDMLATSSSDQPKTTGQVRLEV